VELVKDDQLDFPVPLELANQLPVGTEVKIEIKIGLLFVADHCEL